MASYGAFVDSRRAHRPRLRPPARSPGARLGGALAPGSRSPRPALTLVENAFLLLIVGGGGGSAAPPLATACASVKWTLIAIAIGYVAWGVCAWLLHALRRSRGEAAL